MKRWNTPRWVSAVLAAFLVLVTLAPATAIAQTQDDSLEVLLVDLTEDEGRIVYNSNVDGEVAVRSADGEVEAAGVPLSRSAIERWTVVIVDDSQAADQSVGLDELKSAANRYISGLSAGTKVMLYRAGGGNPNLQRSTGFESDHSVVQRRIDQLTPGGGSVVWDSIARSASLLTEEGDGIFNIVAFVASPGSASTSSVAEARGALLTSDASFTAIMPEVASLDYGPFSQLANTAPGGGVELPGTLADGSQEPLADVAASVASTFENTKVATFLSQDLATADAVELRVGEQRQTVRAKFGSALTGQSLEAPSLPVPGRFAALQGDTGLMIAVGLGVLAALGFTYAMINIFAPDDDSLIETLSIYGEDPYSNATSAEEKTAAAKTRSQIIEQVVERAEQAAAARGNLKASTTMLERAEVPLRVGEAMTIQVVLVVAAFAIGFVALGSVAWGLILVVPAAALPMGFVKYKVNKRRSKLAQQLPDTLHLLSSTLKAGYSLIQGIEAVGREGEEPLAGEFRQLVSEARLGRDLDDALDDLGQRVESEDLEWAIVAIKIQREIGGNLAELLTTVAETITARSRLKGEVKSLTAEGRMSAYVLLALPVCVFIAMYFMNREYLSELWSSTLGYAALGVGAFGMIIGTIWMNKIIDIKV